MIHASYFINYKIVSLKILFLDTANSRMIKRLSFVKRSNSPVSLVFSITQKHFFFTKLYYDPNEFHCLDYQNGFFYI